MVETNVIGLCASTRALLPRMIARTRTRDQLARTPRTASTKAGRCTRPTKHSVRVVSETRGSSCRAPGSASPRWIRAMAETEFSVVRLGDTEKARRSTKLAAFDRRGRGRRDPLGRDASRARQISEVVRTATPRVPEQGSHGMILEELNGTSSSAAATWSHRMASR